MQRVNKLGERFFVRTDPKEIEAFLDDMDFGGDTLPDRVITTADEDGDSGLWWESFEQYWVEFGCCPEQLDPQKLLAELTAWANHPANQKKAATA